MRNLLFLVLLFPFVVFPQVNTAVVKGRVTSAENNSPLQNANILIPETSAGTVTDAGGKFTISLPFGSYTLKATYVGFEPYERKLTLAPGNSSIELLIELKPSAIQTDDITVTGKKEEPATVVQEIEAQDLQRMPTMYNDVLRAVQILPGVISNNEMSSGYNVRGGNFDDNLIYLNGFEIYRPFLLRQGSEENQTLINPDLTNEFRFYNGSFPASYGDKMSSALEVNYSLKNIDSLSGILRANFINAGLSVKNKTGDLRFAAGIRYAYPGLFLSSLQTNGDYKPSFSDIQVLADYNLGSRSNIEVFLLYAINKFDLTPTDWIGSFGGFSRGDYRGLEIYYNGERTYSFKTGLFGLTYSFKAGDNSLFKLSAARYNTIEEETSNLSNDSYYVPDVQNNKDYKEYIKSGQENVNNRLDLVSYEISPQFQIKAGSHLFTAGAGVKLSDVDNIVNEFFTEEGETVVSDFPFDRSINQQFKLDSYNAFIQDDYSISKYFVVNAGIRANYYDYNEELLISPRLNLVFMPSILHSFTLSWGYYYQPPYYAELRNKGDISQNKLKAQRAIHYTAGWEYQFKHNLKLNIEAYYKDLFNLIPYYIDREKTEYLNNNGNEGFAYGFDVMVQGELVDGMNSWLGYGFLNTQERAAGSGDGYQRRLTDNRHSVVAFFQHALRKLPHWQTHMRLLFNTGYAYNQREIVTDEQTQQKYIGVVIDDVRDYPAIYLRMDVGVSGNFEIGNYDLVVVAEVLNIFDHRNYGGYRFVHVTPDIPSPFAIPQVLSSRFVNLGIEIKF